jgi:polysaccharide biosynthesis/export protein
MTLGRRAMAATRGRSRGGALRQCIRAAALLGALTFCSPLLANSPADSRAYTLAPGDRITVAVFGQAELSGDILVDGAGNILLPFIGPIEVRDLTILECEKLIHDRLADGFLNQPSVSVRISEFRPIYVLGDVRTPGAYPFRYGSTVKSVVAVAGGFGQALPAQNSAVSEFLLADERLRQLTSQQRALLVRRARIEAQRDGMKSFSLPSLPSPAAENDAAETIAIEKETFDTQALMVQNQLDLLRSQKPRIQNEIGSLDAQIATTKKQIELINQRSDQYNELVKKGAGLNSTVLELKLTAASYESELWRLTAEVSRLQLDTGELDLKIQEAEASFKRQILAELRDVRERLRELEVTLPSAREIREVKLHQAGILDEAEAAHSISLTRARNGEAAVLQATETTPLEPGDVVELKRLLPREPRQQSASVGQLSRAIP